MNIVKRIMKFWKWTTSKRRGKKVFPWHAQKGSIILCDLWTESIIFQGEYFMFSIKSWAEGLYHIGLLSCLPGKLNCLMNSLNLAGSPLQSFTTSSLPTYQKLFRYKLLLGEWPWSLEHLDHGEFVTIHWTPWYDKDTKRRQSLTLIWVVTETM